MGRLGRHRNPPYMKFETNSLGLGIPKSILICIKKASQRQGVIVELVKVLGPEHQLLLSQAVGAFVLIAADIDACSKRVVSGLLGLG